MKKLIIFLITISLISCSKKDFTYKETSTLNTLTYHVYNSIGEESIYSKKFNHYITSTDSTIYLNECIAESLKSKITN